MHVTKISIDRAALACFLIRLMTALIPVKRVRVRVRRRLLACLPTPWVKELWENL